MNDQEKLAHRLYRLLPPRFSPSALDQAISEGMLPKSDLVDGARYWGWCRNASQARWDGARSRFVYRRIKFGSSFDEDIVHPEDDEGFDVFVPVARVEEGSQEMPVRGRQSSVPPGDQFKL